MSNANPFYHYKESAKFVSADITFQFTNDGARWFNKVNKLADRIDNLKPALTKWYDYLLGSYKRTFRDQGRPKWARLSDYTIRDRIRRGYGSAPILDRGGGLHNPESQYKEVEKHMSATITKDSIDVESNITTKSGYNLFALHQLGWTHQSGKRVPARPLTIQDRDKGQLTIYLQDYLLGDD